MWSASTSSSSSPAACASAAAASKCGREPASSPAERSSRPRSSATRDPALGVGRVPGRRGRRARRRTSPAGRARVPPGSGRTSPAARPRSPRGRGTAARSRPGRRSPRGRGGRPSCRQGRAGVDSGSRARTGPTLAPILATVRMTGGGGAVLAGVVLLATACSSSGTADGPDQPTDGHGVRDPGRHDRPARALPVRHPGGRRARGRSPCTGPPAATSRRPASVPPPTTGSRSCCPRSAGCAAGAAGLRPPRPRPASPRCWSTRAATASRCARPTQDADPLNEVAAARRAWPATTSAPSGSSCSVRRWAARSTVMAVAAGADVDAWADVSGPPPGTASSSPPLARLAAARRARGDGAERRAGGLRRRRGARRRRRRTLRPGPRRARVGAAGRPRRRPVTRIGRRLTALADPRPQVDGPPPFRFGVACRVCQDVPVAPAGRRGTAHLDF